MSLILEGAASIAGRLAGEALSHGGRCTWIGPRVDPGRHGDPELVHVALGPELYDGTAGVAVALAEVARLTGDAEVASVARAAAAHALSRAEDVPPDREAGLYAGRIGIALGVARTGLAVGPDDLVEKACALASGVRPGAALDLVDGRAGGVVGLLALAGLCEQPGLVDRAVEMGEALLATRGTGLAGLAHGDAGLVLALAHLDASTGERRYSRAAEDVAASERSLLDTEEGDWPDVRDARPGRPPRFSPGWCIGAPGIALSRLRAWQATGDETHHADGRVARAATERALTRRLAVPAADWCLCHGIAGLAEIVVESGRQDHGDAAQRTAEDAARTAVERYERTGDPWPSRVPGIEWRGLMQGVAGIALFLARLHDPRIGSVLAPDPGVARTGGRGEAADEPDTWPRRVHPDGAPASPS